MKCLNKSLPVIQEALKVVRSEPLLAQIVDELEGNITIEGIFDKLSELEENAYLSRSVSEKQKDFFAQINTGKKQTIAKKETIAKVKELAKKMGVSITDLATYAKESKLEDASINAVADLTAGVVAIAEGKEDVAITEEIIHIATAILEQTNPKLVTEMISKIGRFKIYAETLAAYKDLKAYQLLNGKPDIRKIKKEAADKLLAEILINNNQDTENFPELTEMENISFFTQLWRNMLDFLKGMYRKSNIDIFSKTAAVIEGQDIGTVADIKEGGVFYQTDEQKAIQEKIAQTKATIIKVESTEKVDPLLSDSDEPTNWYEVILPDGKRSRVLKRVTDKVKAWYKQRFGNKVFTDAENKFNELKRTFGIKGHNDFQEIIGRFYDTETGKKRDKPLPKPTKFNLPDEDMYNMIEGYIVELMTAYPDANFFSEVVVYDPKEKEAGTIDLLLVDKDGTASIFDWKFMQVHGEDVAWFKQGAYNIQISRYKNILKDNYGIKKFDRLRAVPIVMEFSLKDKKDPTSSYVSKLGIGTVNPNEFTPLKYLAVSATSESTGIDQLDRLVSKMNGLLKEVGKEKATTDEEREFKIERLNTIRQAIRLIQGRMDIKPLINTIEVIRKEGETLLNEYNAIYKDKKASKKDFSNQDLSDFSNSMNSYIASADVFGDIMVELGDLIYTEEMEKLAKTADDKADVKERKETYNKLLKETTKIKQSREEIRDAAKSFADKHIGERNMVFGFLNPEKIIKGLAVTFRGVSQLPLTSLEILYRLTREAQGEATVSAMGKIKQLMILREEIMKRPNAKEAISKLFQSDDKNKFTNKLIYRFKKEFYDTLSDKALAGGDLAWIKANVNIEEYKKEADEHIKKRTEQINKHSYPGTAEEAENHRDRDLEKINREFNIEHSKFTGWNNDILARHPQLKWESKEYQELKKDDELFKLYNFIVDINKQASDEGYINAKIQKTFLPWVRKSAAEKLVFDGKVSVVQDFFKSLEVRADDIGYGAINEMTKQLEYSLPKYYTNDFSKKADGENDYSDVSEDIFKNMILYINELEKYKSLSQIEGQLNLVKSVEAMKNSIKTSALSEVVMEHGEKQIVENNQENLKTFDEFLRAIFYKQKYVLSDSDADLGIGKVTTAFKKLVNGIAGKEVFKPEEAVSVTSMVKGIDNINRGFQLKTLGLEFISGAVNWFGTNMQISAQAGNYFKGREFTINQVKLLNQSWLEKPEEREAFAELLNLFMPLNEDAYLEEYNKAGISRFTRGNIGNMLMVFMRKPEQHSEKSIFLSLLDNMMVENGRIVSIREYVKNKHKDRYASSSTYNQSKPLIDKEIEELKKTRSISATKKMENGKLVIPGLDTSDIAEVRRLTNLTKTLSRDATGSLSQEDLNRMSMSIWTKSMMIFKNWIPKLTDTRFSELRKVGDDFSLIVNDEGILEGQKYDIGRIRLLGYVLFSSMVERQTNLYNIMSMNDKGIATIDKMFEEFAAKYEKRTGLKLNMSKADFTDMIRNNLRNQLKELAALGSLLGIMLSMGFMAPDDDKDKATKNVYRYAQRVVDKFVGELSFFYNPLNYESLLSGGLFPAIGLVNDFIKFVGHFFLETTGMDLSDPTKPYADVVKDAKPMKYMAKMLPVTKSLLVYRALFDTEFAKEYDITIQKESNMR